MIIKQKEYQVYDLRYITRSADEKDAKTLSDVRLHIDGETYINELCWVMGQ
ncbi:hypothetical protein KP77_04320 [Jeotgalibacillus alimentarius]|uniref:Uncharacterized protein n=1 Tax=Jeotgalibacillus alimentarius TaxID=135826 RepID=A0A0C2WA50_9BACL|nr:hypothetical protein [Jeotgalibacillus alimentarius]KIL53456.1 hypothetical protein KP77_04320 [Jeotgalibacillus alimentarius]